MADTRLIQAIDFILNHSDEATIEVLAEAVIKRRRNLTMFQAIGNIPDPEKMAKEISSSLGGGTEKIMGGMKQSIQEMIVRICREHAPELNEKQINELCQAWLPSPNSAGKKGAKTQDLPPDVLLSMIEQFISFSNGTMTETVDKGLREELGAWPQRYWDTFPAVIRQFITDYLKDKITHNEFKSKIVLALGL
ncbi:MAG: hypothetical protein LBC80_05365 [Treponema sp.]|jgi:hypothetical protein|nr:hypothetical protein [Treponema sp.]